ncbi:conserved membrane protein of unknown function [Cupriavidus taiwanensis]|uniref:Uncharacterized protein n=1 Tax=Cupriavidus taiwanensis TaxID=164546 RepID=A0A7Z7JCZ5_9BURK|nr:conserved membrane protein of unknown function [Cupriavidus taiwanensis]SOZ43501.1 conserved membrane protein of unknown function [Cupriavidus taiwanensis]SPC22743.1 conserved membrane protein of unknown function [Cupriavidus taiwanensis]
MPFSHEASVTTVIPAQAGIQRLSRPLREKVTGFPPSRERRSSTERHCHSIGSGYRYEERMDGAGGGWRDVAGRGAGRHGGGDAGAGRQERLLFLPWHAVEAGGARVCRGGGAVQGRQPGGRFAGKEDPRGRQGGVGQDSYAAAWKSGRGRCEEAGGVGAWGRLSQGGAWAAGAASAAAPSWTAGARPACGGAGVGVDSVLAVSVGSWFVVLGGRCCSAGARPACGGAGAGVDSALAVSVGSWFVVLGGRGLFRRRSRRPPFCPSDRKEAKSASPKRLAKAALVVPVIVTYGSVVGSSTLLTLPGGAWRSRSDGRTRL